MPDLNTFVGSGEVQHIDFGDPHSFLELKILGPAGAVTFISVHVPVALLRTLYTLDRGTKVMVRGPLMFVKGDRPQHVIKAISIEKVDADGRLLPVPPADPPALSAAPLSRPVGGDRRRHKRRKRG